jgi:hypothetical protein
MKRDQQNAVHRPAPPPVPVAPPIPPPPAYSSYYEGQGQNIEMNVLEWWIFYLTIPVYNSLRFYFLETVFNQYFYTYIICRKLPYLKKNWINLLKFETYKLELFFAYIPPNINTSWNNMFFLFFPEAGILWDFDIMYLTSNQKTPLHHSLNKTNIYLYIMHCLLCILWLLILLKLNVLKFKFLWKLQFFLTFLILRGKRVRSLKI